MKSPILHELERHAPFTASGVLLGVILMAIFYKLPHKLAFNIFYVLHPMHVLLGAIVTASMYRNYKCALDRHGCNIFTLLAISYAGSIGIATLSDSLLPYLGELILKMPYAEAHIGFVEKWYFVLPLAGIGTIIAYFYPTTKMPHAGHILISTWASLFHVIMAGGEPLSFFSYAVIFVFLFIAVWMPCCFSDIVFPLLFVGRKE